MLFKGSVREDKARTSKLPRSLSNGVIKSTPMQRLTDLDVGTPA